MVKCTSTRRMCCTTQPHARNLAYVGAFRNGNERKFVHLPFSVRSLAWVNVDMARHSRLKWLTSKPSVVRVASHLYRNAIKQ